MTVRVFGLRSCAGSRRPAGAPGCGAEPGRRSPGSPGRQAGPGVPERARQIAGARFRGARTLLPSVIFRAYLTPLLIFPGRILLPIKFSRALSYLGQNFSGARVCAHHAGNSPFATYISHACENIFAVFARNSQIS